eukprot:sb/3469948/
MTSLYGSPVLVETRCERVFSTFWNSLPISWSLQQIGLTVINAEIGKNVFLNVLFNTNPAQPELAFYLVGKYRPPDTPKNAKFMHANLSLPVIIGKLPSWYSKTAALKGLKAIKKSAAKLQARYTTKLPNPMSLWRSLVQFPVKPSIFFQFSSLFNSCSELIIQSIRGVIVRLAHSHDGTLLVGTNPRLARYCVFVNDRDRSNRHSVKSSEYFALKF